VVRDIRLKPGQEITPGEVAMTLQPDDAKFAILAVLPGRLRPQLVVGQQLKLRIPGFRRVLRDVPVAWIGDQVVGPKEVEHELGPLLREALPVGGSSALVRTASFNPTFAYENGEYQLFEGMLGTADIRIGSRTILSALIKRAD